MSSKPTIQFIRAPKEGAPWIHEPKSNGNPPVGTYKYTDGFEGVVKEYYEFNGVLQLVNSELSHSGSRQLQWMERKDNGENIFYYSGTDILFQADENRAFVCGNGRLCIAGRFGFRRKGKQVVHLINIG